MGTEVAVFGAGAAVPAFVKQRGELSAVAKALAGRGEFGKRLSIKGGVFRLIAGGKEVSAIEERYLDVIIVAAAEKIGRTFYAKKFSPDDAASPPDCWSANGDTPDPSVKTPPSPSCQTCPNNAKGSGEGDSRACRFSQRVAIVLQNDPAGDVLQLQIPAASLFGKEEGDQRPLQAYARWLAAQNVSPEEVVTRLKFDTKAESPKLFFKAMRWLEEEEYAIAKKQGATEDAKNAITMTVAQQDGVAHTPPADALPPKGAKPDVQPEPAAGSADDDAEPPPPPPATGKAKKDKKDKKVEAPKDEDEPPPPAVRSKPDAAAAVPARKNLAATIANWDADD